MISFQLDGQVIHKENNINIVPRVGEKINFTSKQEGIYRVLDVEYDYSKPEIHSVLIIVHLTFFKNS